MASDGKYNFDFKGRKVLVVEDNEMSFRLIAAVLKRVNVQTIRARDGKEAISLSAGKDDIELVLMDMQLPGMDGLEATKAIKATRPGLPVLATTANAFHEDREACRDAGCDGFLSKPLNFRGLFERMEDLLST